MAWVETGYLSILWLHRSYEKSKVSNGASDK